MDPTSCTGGQNLLDSVGFKKKKKGDEVETMVFCGDFGSGGGYVQGTLLACINQAVRMFLNI